MQSIQVRVGYSQNLDKSIFKTELIKILNYCRLFFCTVSAYYTNIRMKFERKSIMSSNSINQQKLSSQYYS